MLDSRFSTKIINEICQRKKIILKGYANGWILELIHKSKTKYIFGYKFPIDESTKQMLCDDKSALSEKLINSKIECVPHYFLMLPTDVIHLSSNDKNLMKITKMLKKQRVIVIKPNNGTGGEHVYKISNNDELITRAKIIFTHYSSLAYSPYYSISHEYRVVIINQKSVLVYEKIRATSEWRHNLGLGAKSVDITNIALRSKLNKLALKAANAIGIKFCSVDIVQAKNQLMILEINSGLMFEKYSQNNKRKLIIAKIYTQIIDYMFSKNNLVN